MCGVLQVFPYIYENVFYLKTEVSFGGKVLMDDKSPPLFFWSILILTHIFFVFVFSFSLFQWIGPENAAEGSWGVNLVTSSPKVHSKVR